MMAAEEEIEVEAPAPLMNLEEVHNSGGNEEVHDEMSTIELPNDDDASVGISPSSSWTRKKKYATAALALASVVILAIAIGTPTGINSKNNSNNDAVTSSMMSLENCLSIMKKLELDNGATTTTTTPEPSTYEPTTYTPTPGPTDPPVPFSNDVADLLDDDESVRVRDLRGGRSTKNTPENEARRMQDECDAIIEAHGGSSGMSSKSGKSTKSPKSTKGYKPTTPPATSQPTSPPTPDVEVTSEPTPAPTSDPTKAPTSDPTSEPTSDPTSQPTSDPTSQPEDTSSPTPAPVCIKIVTGDQQSNDGFIDVFVSSGTTGYIKVTPTPGFTPGVGYNKTVVVLDDCYDNFIGLQVTNSDNNAWVGSIKSSDNAGGPFSPMTCEQGCTGGISTETIAVDGDLNGASLAPVQCLNGRVDLDGNICTILVDTD